MPNTNLSLPELSLAIKQWGQDLGFQQVGITDIDLSDYEPRFLDWLAQGFHGEMQYMQSHGEKRYKPALLHPETVRVISVRMDYLPANTQRLKVLANKDKAYISRYALGRDYHKVIRQRLKKLADQIQQKMSYAHYRVFADSAPVLEKPLAEKAGLGWIGKNTNLINRHAGSWFFLGEIFTNIPLITDTPVTNHCGSCKACLTICPTQAFTGPYLLDARRCISYLTIELKGSIPVELRAMIGNRVYGCDDCQLVCPWNRYAKPTDEKDFHPRHGLEDIDLVTLFLWDELTFLAKTEGSAMRRVGYESWLRNIAVGLGNSAPSAKAQSALKSRLDHPSEIVREHVEWALKRQNIFS